MSRARSAARLSGSQPPSDDEGVVLTHPRSAGPSPAEFTALREQVEAQSALMQRLADRLDEGFAPQVQAVAPPSGSISQTMGAPQQRPLEPEGLEEDWRVQMVRNEATAKALRARKQLGEPAATQPGQPTTPTWDLARQIIISLAKDSDVPDEDRLGAQQWLEADALQAAATRPPSPPTPPTDDSFHPPGPPSVTECEEEWQRLVQIVEPDSSKAADAKYRNAFSGYDLACEHDRRANPFRRNEQFEARTCHYRPSVVGDTLSAETHDSLVKKGCNAGSYELRSLVPSISYMWDLRVDVRKTTADVLSLRDEGDYAAAAEVASDALLRTLKQTDAILEHKLERLAVLRKLADDNQAELALYNNLYDKEYVTTRAMGRTQESVEADTSAGQVRFLVALSAKEKAINALGPGARTRQQQGTRNEAGRPPPVPRQLADAPDVQRYAPCIVQSSSKFND